MPEDLFCSYLKELEYLNGEIRQCPAFDTRSMETREHQVRRFELHRTLVNLLHFTTIHMMRNGARDYDAESTRWITGLIAQATLRATKILQEEDADSVRDLATQAMDLTHEIVGKLDNATTVA